MPSLVYTISMVSCNNFNEETLLLFEECFPCVELHGLANYWPRLTELRYNFEVQLTWYLAM